MSQAPNWNFGTNEVSSFGHFPFHFPNMEQTAVTVSCWKPSETGGMRSTALLLQFIDKAYEMNDYVTISRFLYKHPFLLNILVEAFFQVQLYFGDKAQFALELPQSVGAEDQELFLLIKTNKTPAEARDIMNQLDDNWWLEKVRETKFLMNIDVEYI